MRYDMKECGNRIRQIRKTRGMTQEQLALKLNIGDRYLRKIENGEQVPSIDTLLEIATQLGVSLDYITTGSQLQDNLKQRLRDAVQNMSTLVEEL